MKNYILIVCLIVVSAFTKAQNITAAEYFIDTDPGVGLGTALTINNVGNDITDSFTVNIGNLPVGFHRFYTRVQDANSVWSHYDKFLFYVADPTPITNPQLPTIVAAEYFLETDPGFGNATAINLGTPGANDMFMFDIDFSSLPGCSTTPFHLRVQDANGTWSLYDFDPALEIPGRTAPTLDVATLADVSGTCEVTSLTAPTATDACTSASITGTTDAVLPITSNTTITWTYDDGNGNIATQTQNVVIVDNTAPVADVATLADINEQCEVTSLIAPTATDNCAGTVTVTNDATLPITSSSIITWTYDDGNGNTTTQSQNVVIVDTTSPIADVATLADITAECELLSLTAPTATDNCSGIITGVNSVSLPITSDTVITWTYDDGNGNVITQNQNVFVSDTQPPVPNVNPNDAFLPDVVSQCAVMPTLPTALDACTGQTVTAFQQSTVAFPITQSVTVLWGYDDGNGNILGQFQNFTINDTTAPVPDMASLPDIIEQCEVTTLNFPSATDNCDPNIFVNYNLNLPITSSTTITWSYTDTKGNESTQTQNVIITDTVNPVAIGQDITIDLAGNNSITITGADVDNGSTDNCGISNLVVFPDVFTAVGIYPAILTAVDGAGNVNTASVQVTVEDTLSNDSLELEQLISFYPNPTNSTLFIESELQLDNIQLNDLTGKLLLSRNKEFNEINMDDYSPGIYFIKVTTETGASITQKIIKN